MIKERWGRGIYDEHVAEVEEGSAWIEESAGGVIG